MSRHVWQGIAALALGLGIVACAGSDIPLAKSTTGRNPTVAEVPSKDETLRGDTDPPIVTLNLKHSLRERRLTAADDLPGNIIIPTTNLNGVPITAALQAVLSGTDISLSWNAGALGNRLVTVMNLSGPLPKVVQKICSAAKVFCNYRHGSIELSEKETFIVGLPPIARQIATTSGFSSGSSSSSSSSSSSTGLSQSVNNSTNTMVDAIDSLLGSEDKAVVDEQGGTIVYTASVEAQDRISQYLNEIRHGRPLIVLQMYIWEVTLNRDNAQGINWSSFRIPDLDVTATNSLTSLASSTGNVSLGAVTSGTISATAVASFLATKGQVQTISNPQLTFVSGSNAQLRVGGTQRYISEVGTVTYSNVSGTTGGSTSNSNTNTVSTDEIDTGLAISVAGSYENGVVFANMELTLRNLVSLNPTTSGGQTIDLPETTDENMSTVLRVRPGDSLVLAGLVSSADTNASQGLPTGSESALPLYGSEKRSNRELVIIVKPSIILFSDAADEAKEKQQRETAKPLPAAVMIDKDGSRALALPDASGRTVPPSELYASATYVPSRSANDDAAPVDKTLMQRGFSRAFDQLLQSGPDGGGL